MSKQKGPQKGGRGASLTDKIKSSLALKLNVHLAVMLFSAFFTVNLVLVIGVTGTTLFRIERETQLVIDSLENATYMIYQPLFEEKGFQVRSETVKNGVVEPSGRLLPRALQEMLPVESLEARRDLKLPPRQHDISLAQRIDRTTYHLNLTIQHQPHEIIYQIGPDLNRLLLAGILLLALEMFVFLGSLVEGVGAIRKTLKPIADMAATTKSLNEQVAALGPDGTGLKDLTGEISSIDASQLDRRLAVDESQKELKELAQAINQMLNRINAAYQSQVRFVSDASHELRTPISVIQGYVNLLDRWGKKDEKTLQESIDAIKGETESMKALVEQLLFLARGDTESMQLHLEPVEAVELVEEIVREAQLIDSHHTFETRLQTSVLLTADRQLMKQAIRILLENSMKYTPAGEVISLRVNQMDSQVHITVQDNGIGIEPEDLPHIFDRFYRSDESRARKTGGSGLGLAIAKWIIQRHHGHVEVISRVDIGTRTTIMLPETTETAVSPEPTTEAMKERA
ncbi:sensor histidine kinase [Anoxynatronum sibiricum]|uniref:histidine kinase n=1 Tax=Anoxynatronum sibiricum TaxID=210623 RepID=A0ABU9VY46_9CLOT